MKVTSEKRKKSEKENKIKESLALVLRRKYSDPNQPITFKFGFQTLLYFRTKINNI